MSKEREREREREREKERKRERERLLRNIDCLVDLTNQSNWFAPKSWE